MEKVTVKVRGANQDWVSAVRPCVFGDHVLPKREGMEEVNKNKFLKELAR